MNNRLCAVIILPYEDSHEFSQVRYTGRSFGPLLVFN